jgi:hypothetical protein
MNKFLILLLLLLPIFGFAQKSYSFDYLTEYQFQKLETSKPRTRWMLTNASDNSYYAIVSDLGENKVLLRFFDQKSGVRARVELPKDGFFEGQLLKMRCKYVSYHPPIKRIEKDGFSIFQKKDTLVGHATYKQYALSHLISASKEDEAYGEATVVVENDTEFHKPVFYSMFAVTTSLIPNGIAKEAFVHNKDKHRHEAIYKLVGYTKTLKTLTIPKDCDYGPSEATGK